MTTPICSDWNSVEQKAVLTQVAPVMQVFAAASPSYFNEVRVHVRIAGNVYELYARRLPSNPTFLDVEFLRIRDSCKASLRFANGKFFTPVTDWQEL